MAPPAPRRPRSSRKNSQAGQGLVEYGLIFALIVIVAIFGLTFLGTTVSGYLSSVGTSI